MSFSACVSYFPLKRVGNTAFEQKYTVHKRPVILRENLNLIRADASRKNMSCMRLLSNHHYIMLCGMYRNAEHVQLVSVLDQDGKRSK